MCLVPGPHQAYRQTFQCKLVSFRIDLDDLEVRIFRQQFDRAAGLAVALDGATTIWPFLALSTFSRPANRRP
jgi:hypothetical protein